MPREMNQDGSEFGPPMKRLCYRRVKIEPISLKETQRRLWLGAKSATLEVRLTRNAEVGVLRIRGVTPGFSFPENVANLSCRAVDRRARRA